MAFGSESIFTALIDEQGNILVVTSGRDYKKVGIDSRREAELIQEIKERDETLDNWRGVLIENGLLKIPKTAEEIATEAAAENMVRMQEQARINQALLNAVEGLQQTIEEMKANERTQYTGEIFDKRTDSHVSDRYGFDKIETPSGNNRAVGGRYKTSLGEDKAISSESI